MPIFQTVESPSKPCSCDLVKICVRLRQVVVYRIHPRTGKHMTLDIDLESIEPKAVPSPLPGYDMVRGYGVLGLPFSTGHVLALRVFPQRESKALFDGQDLGKPVRVEQNPVIGSFNLPARPVFAEGRAYFQILDIQEYRRLRRELSQKVTLPQ